MWQFGCRHNQITNSLSQIDIGIPNKIGILREAKDLLFTPAIARLTKDPPYGFPINSTIAATSTSIPVFRLGSRSGAKYGECGPGSSSPLFFAAAYFSGFTAPNSSMTLGIPP